MGVVNVDELCRLTENGKWVENVDGTHVVQSQYYLKNTNKQKSDRIRKNQNSQLIWSGTDTMSMNSY